MRSIAVITLISALLIGGAAPAVAADGIGSQVADIMGRVSDGTDAHTLLVEMEAIDLSTSTPECGAMWAISYLMFLAYDAEDRLSGLQSVALGATIGAISDEVSIDSFAACLTSEL